ncbi:MAG: hypothetical protein LBJ02_03920, partial [Bifidobacteriaceae bacterium]|nr:hypothetical protein [Bifidobacteriaceae bacterium]
GRTGPEDGELYDPADVPVDQQSLVGSDYEIAIAVADFGCRAATDYVGRYTQIQFDLETAYIAAHQTELDKMVAVAQG